MPNNFRETPPIKRASPKVVKKYREYKPYLKEDYHSNCGYCNDPDHWCGGWRFYQLDHFVPQKYLVTISKTEYSNLVYTCFFCNNSKRAKWPTKDEKIANDGKEGFVHPIEADYVDHLHRDSYGRIIPTTDVGKYMVKAMKLHLKRHAIIWNLEQLQKRMDEIEIEYNKIAADKLPLMLAHEIIQLHMGHNRYFKLLKAEANA